MLSYLSFLLLSQRRGAKHIKELLAPSSVKMSKTPSNNTDEIDPNNGSHPCGKPCVYCKLLSKTESDTFKSITNGNSFKIRQEINCQSTNIIYLVTCMRSNIQGVGRSVKSNRRMSNYFSHIKQKKRTCDIVNHFIDNHSDEWSEDYETNDIFHIIDIAKITNLPSDPKLKATRFWEFEGYWHVKLNTVKPFGMNDINDYKEFPKNIDQSN